MTKSVLIIGSGSMGSALARGIATSPAAANTQVAVYDIHSHRLEVLKEFSSLRLVTALE